MYLYEQSTNYPVYRYNKWHCSIVLGWGTRWMQVRTCTLIQNYHIEEWSYQSQFVLYFTEATEAMSHILKVCVPLSWFSSCFFTLSYSFVRHPLHSKQMSHPTKFHTCQAFQQNEKLYQMTQLLMKPPKQAAKIRLKLCCLSLRSILK